MIGHACTHARCSTFHPTHGWLVCNLPDGHHGDHQMLTFISAGSGHGGPHRETWPRR